MNAYDVGWIKVVGDRPQRGLQLSGALIQSGKQLRLPNAEIELASPTFDLDMVRTGGIRQFSDG